VKVGLTCYRGRPYVRASASMTAKRCCWTSTPWNQGTSESCRSRGRGRGATRCSRRCCERRRRWCRCKSHHGRHGRRCHGLHCYHATVVSAAVVTSGHRRPSDVVAQHNRGRHSSPGRRHSQGRVGRQTPRV
jgi:hypothetical protein